MLATRDYRTPAGNERRLPGGHADRSAPRDLYPAPIDDKRARTLHALASCLRGEIPTSVAWEELIRQANDHLVTPRLHGVFSTRRHLVPADLGDYVQLLHELNLDRNRRLKEQAIEAIGALNAADIRPTLLKGTIILLTCPARDLGSRMTSDLDLLLAPGDLKRGSEVLRGLGYLQLDGDVGEHAHGKFYRSRDAGMVDLHHRPPGPDKLYPAWRPELGEAVSIGACGVRLPSPASRMVHLIAHDMFNDGGLSGGRIQLRHLFDVADLIQRETVDWRWVRDRFFGPKLSLGFDVYVLNLVRIAKVSVPCPGRRSMMAHLFFRRQMLKERSNRFRRLDDRAVGAIRQFRQARRVRPVEKDDLAIQR